MTKRLLVYIGVLSLVFITSGAAIYAQRLHLQEKEALRQELQALREQTETLVQQANQKTLEPSPTAVPEPTVAAAVTVAPEAQISPTILCKHQAQAAAVNSSNPSLLEVNQEIKAVQLQLFALADGATTDVAEDLAEASAKYNYEKEYSQLKDPTLTPGDRARLMSELTEKIRTEGGGVGAILDRVTEQRRQDEEVRQQSFETKQVHLGTLREAKEHYQQVEYDRAFAACINN